ncbi:MAG: hypothetical protein OEY52_01615 [Gammaproteobacteria bacterium]|nr:hypothetical protein [Gammaproteobacteria bacterium]
MHGLDTTTTIFIVLTVIFFMLFGIAILVIVDHKAKIPDSFHSDPFSISGMRRDHPWIGFLTTLILGSIIFALLFELSVAFASKLGFFKEKEQPKLLQKLSEQRFTEKMRHFHNEPEQDLVNMGKKPVCFYCHGDYPHSKQRMVRTLLNMHTQFIGCMTCHNDAKKFNEEKLSFYWLNYSGITVSGPPYGTSIDQKTGYLVTTDNYYSKVVAYYSNKGKDELLEITEDSADAKEFIQVKDKLSERDRDSVKKAFHKTVMSKGRFCTRCHTSENKSYLPFRKLGFSEQRVSDLTNLNIVGIVQKYKKFYMPSLTKSAPQNKEVKQQKSGADEKKSGAWWR